MEPQAVLTIAQQAMFILLTVAAPILGTVLVVGLVISLFQALTQINEATLSFVPKLIAAVAVIALTGPWMLTTLVEYIRRVLLAIPDYAV
ncbi:fliQ: flagellar biosynthetic protein FliQ [Tepidimonas fonticaldi]|uniref:Flagellar biosynthetic protein FliQ n=1 Tax=Tepidimonas fonticaldi TaxID=1101373 RepID=A0A1A6DU46_9BURK|nr:flagellar biosynthesis protein FliQ [Tepidimonas fonticaldi]OBS30442.1 flagellar biosynthetic protein FliQ [Tepidimonas fonticaldi]TSE36665.1 fliQ: flagellar biosynthetic protein FliQ [Tepidimonas fonticaldi]